MQWWEHYMISYINGASVKVSQLFSVLVKLFFQFRFIFSLSLLLFLPLHLQILTVIRKNCSYYEPPETIKYIVLARFLTKI